MPLYSNLQVSLIQSTHGHIGLPTVVLVTLLICLKTSLLVIYYYVLLNIYLLCIVKCNVFIFRINFSSIFFENIDYHSLLFTYQWYLFLRYISVLLFIAFAMLLHENFIE